MVSVYRTDARSSRALNANMSKTRGALRELHTTPGVLPPARGRNGFSSNDVARRVETRVGQPNGRDDPVAPPLGWPERNKNGLILARIHGLPQFAFQFDFFRCRQVTLKYGILEVVAVIAADPEDLAQPLVVRDVVANKVGVSHGQVASWCRASRVQATIRVHPDKPRYPLAGDKGDILGDLAS